MPRFTYQIRTNTGRSDTGLLTASDLEEASRLLRKEGNTIVDLREDNGAVAANWVGHSSKVTREDVVYVAAQLAVMVDTGVPVTLALETVCDQSDHAGLKTVLGDVIAQLKNGMEFSRALQRHPKVFSRLFVAMMRASEASGTMGAMLQRVCEHMQQERDMIKRVKGALVYPLCLLGFCMLATVGLLVFILPRFESIYVSKGVALPAPTAMLLGLSAGLRDHWLLIMATLFAIGAPLYLAMKSAAGEAFLDRLRIRLPVLGAMYRKACIARSLRTMATMVSTGVSTLEGLSITAEVAGNSYFQKIWTEVAAKVKEGSGISEELIRCPMIPRTVTQMISAGERTGRLSSVMNKVASFCEEDFKVAIKTVTTMIEPAMIIIMGLMIGSIAMALLLPVFTMSKVVAR